MDHETPPSPEGHTFALIGSIGAPGGLRRYFDGLPASQQANYRVEPTRAQTIRYRQQSTPAQGDYSCRINSRIQTRFGLPKSALNNRIASFAASLGVWGIVFIVVAAASPLGVIGGPVPLGIGLGNGTGFPAIFVVSTLIVLFFAAGFTALTPYVPNAGAFYSYIGRGLGRLAGFGFAFVALMSYLALEVGVYGLIGQGAQALIDSCGRPRIHWGVWALITVAVVALLGHRNIDLSRNVLGVLLIGEVAVVLVLDAVVAFTGGPKGSAGILTPWRSPRARRESPCCSPA